MASNSESERMQLEDVLFAGRTPGEYEQIFGFDLDDFQFSSVLDCPSGPCAFTAAARARGVDATGVDVLYRHTPETLERQCQHDITEARRRFEQTADADRFVWTYYDDIGDVIEHFEAATETFLPDYRQHHDTDRYVQAELPNLPFEDDRFDLVVSAHLLFLYAKQLSHEFHEQSLLEFARVASEEVRVSPITMLSEASNYPRLDDLRETLEAAGHETRIEPSDLALLSDTPERLVITPA
jgi:hypothetical protein